jgi:hypothetical protein
LSGLSDHLKRLKATAIRLWNQPGVGDGFGRQELEKRGRPPFDALAMLKRADPWHIAQAQ